MGRCSKISASLACLVLVATPVAAKEFEPRNEYEALTQRPKSHPAIPPQFSEIIRDASPDRLLVNGLHGNTIEVDISWYEPRDFLMLAGSRYLGFAYTGYEAFGFVLVDRAMSGAAAILDTGSYPMLSPDGRYLAAAELSPSGYGNLNGIALWEINPDQTVRRFFTDALLEAWGWRVDGWSGSECAVVSGIGAEWQPGSEEEWKTMWETAPRLTLELRVNENAVSLVHVDRENACYSPSPYE